MSVGQDEENPSTRRVSIRQVLVMSYGLLVVMASLLALALHRFHQRRLVRQFAGPMLESATRLTESGLDLLFQPVHDRLAGDLLQVQHGALRPQDDALIRDELLPAVYQLRSTSTMIVANNHGDEVIVFPYDTSYRHLLGIAPPGGVPSPAVDSVDFLSRTLADSGSWQVGEWVLWSGKSGEGVANWTVPLPTYSVSNQAWYRAAMSRYRLAFRLGRGNGIDELISWTPAYGLRPLRSPGMTAAVAATDSAGAITVVGYSLGLDALSTLTDRLRPTRRGSSFILTDSSQVLALPSDSLFGPSVDRRELYLRPLSAFSHPVLSAWEGVWQQRGVTEQPPFTFVSGGETWWGSFKPYLLSKTQSVWIGVVLPESDLLVGTKNELLLILLSGAIALAPVVLLSNRMAKWIGAPLARVAEWSEQSRRLDQTPDPMPMSRLQEVAQLGTTVSLMRETLVERMADLETVVGELAESDQRFRGTFDQAAVGILHVDRDGSILRANHRICEILGRTSTEVLAASEWGLIHPDDLDRERQIIDSLYCEDLKTHQWEKRYRDRDGESVWTQVTASLQRNPKGVPIYIIFVVQDIEERRLLEAQLRQAQKLEAVGQLAGGIAHDFNNLLTAILGYTALIRDQLGPDHLCVEDLGQIDTVAERAADLTRQLLAFSSRQVITPQIISIGPLVMSVERLLRPLIPENIQLVLRPSEETAPVRADVGQLQQVLVNLVVNARDAMPDGGVITIRTEDVMLTKADLREHPEARPGPWVCVSVEDTGTGMSPEVLDRIFEPFFTTKPQNKGTGLGLATCYGIVQQLGGHIRVESSLGKGTLFRIGLPALRRSRVKDGRVGALPSTRLTRPSAAGQTILLVEDEEMIRTLSERALRQQGYRVLTAEDGATALHIARRQPHIDLLLTDLVMPGVHGVDLASRLQLERPGLRVLFISGYSEHPAITFDLSVTLLVKPFTADRLVEEVGRTLAGLVGEEVEETQEV